MFAINITEKSRTEVLDDAVASRIESARIWGAAARLVVHPTVKLLGGVFGLGQRPH